MSQIWLQDSFYEHLESAVALLVVRRHVFHVNMRLWWRRLGAFMTTPSKNEAFKVVGIEKFTVTQRGRRICVT